MDTKFGEFVREKRRAKGIKLKDFAAQVGISSVYASYIERGNRPSPVKSKLELMAAALELSEGDKAVMFELADRTHNKIELSPQMTDYLYDRPYISDAIETAIGLDVPEEAWVNFKETVLAKYGNQ